MRGIVGLGLSVILGFVVIAAMPSGAESAANPFGNKGTLVFQNQRSTTTDFVISGSEASFAGRLPPHSKMTLSGVKQYYTYTWGVDVDLNGSTDSSASFILSKRYTLSIDDTF